MSFKYDELNLNVLDDAKVLFAKPSTAWTENEHKRALLIIEALRVVACQTGQTVTECLFHRTVRERDEARLEAAKWSEVAIAGRETCYELREALDFAHTTMNHALELGYCGEGSTKGMVEDAIDRIEKVLPDTSSGERLNYQPAKKDEV